MQPKFFLCSKRITAGADSKRPGVVYCKAWFFDPEQGEVVQTFTTADKVPADLLGAAPDPKAMEKSFPKCEFTIVQRNGKFDVGGFVVVE